MPNCTNYLVLCLSTISPPFLCNTGCYQGAPHYPLPSA